MIITVPFIFRMSGMNSTEFHDIISLERLNKYYSVFIQHSRAKLSVFRHLHFKAVGIFDKEHVILFTEEEDFCVVE